MTGTPAKIPWRTILQVYSEFYSPSLWTLQISNWNLVTPTQLTHMNPE